MSEPCAGLSSRGEMPPLQNANPGAAASTPVHASVMLGELLNDGMPERVSLAWLTLHLEERSFGAYLLTLAVAALLPIASMPIGLLVAALAVQLILGRKNPVLPGFIASREIQSRRIAGLVRRTMAAMTYLETFIRPRWHTLFAAKSFIGLTVFFLALALLVPIPFSNIVPALAIVLIAFAYIERTDFYWR